MQTFFVEMFALSAEMFALSAEMMGVCVVLCVLGPKTPTELPLNISKTYQFVRVCFNGFTISFYDIIVFLSVKSGC